MAHTLPIGAILEALAHPQQQSPELALHFTAPNPTEHNYRIRNNNIHIPLLGDDAEWTLVVPLDEDFGVPKQEVIARCKTTLQHPFLADAHYLRSALTIFDHNNTPHLRDAILQRSAQPIEEFIRLNCSNKHRTRLRRALEHLTLAATTLARSELRLGNLSRKTICFDHDCRSLFIDSPLTQHHTNDSEQLCQAAILLFVAACQPDAYRLLTPKSTTPCEHQRRLSAILCAAEYYAIKPLMRLVEHLQHRRASETLLCHLEEIALEPFRPLPFLTQQLSATTPACVENYDHPTADYQTSVVVDFERCEEVLPTGEDLVRYRLNGLWGYAHSNGNRLPIQRLLLYAGEFSAGRAVVKTPRGYGLMDTSGRMVINDVWEDLDWHPTEGIATASDGVGKWYIYNSEGGQLASVVCDWMGSVSEGFVVARKGNKFGYYATDGRKLTDFIYNEAYGFTNGLALVAYGSNRYHIDDTLHRLSPKEEAFIQRFRSTHKDL